MRTTRATTKLPLPRESEIQANTIRWLTLHGFAVKRRNTGAMPGEYKGKRRFVRFAEPGASDVYGCFPQHSCVGAAHFELEMKRPGNRPTLEQVRWLLAWHDAGAVAFWADSVERMETVMTCILRGGRIRYLDTQREYTVEVGGRKGRVLGPSGDFEVFVG